MSRRLSCLPEIADGLRRCGAPVVVTGARGWLGRAALEMLCGAGLEVLAFGAAEGAVALRSGGTVPVKAFDTLAMSRIESPLVFHFAFRTRGYAAELDYVATNRAIAGTMRGFLERNGARGIFVPSSGAVYARGGLMANPYGALKLEDEAGFAGLGRRLGFPAVVARIFNLAGPFINNLDHYALSCIIRDVLAGGPVTLRADRPVVRSYAHVQDVLNTAAATMLQGADAPVFDTAGEAALEIEVLAQRVAAVLGRRVDIIRPNGMEGAEDRYTGDYAAYQTAAATGGVTLHELDEQILETANYIREIAN